MKVSSDFILREIAGDYILIPTGDTILQFNGLITLNEVGVSLWNLLQKDVTFEALVTAILGEYEVDEATAREDIQEFLESLKKGGILPEDTKIE